MKGDDPVSLHKYLYGKANPIVYSDPSGHISISEETAAVIVVGILVTLTALAYTGVAQNMAEDVAENIGKIELVYRPDIPRPQPSPSPSPSPLPTPYIPDETDEEDRLHRRSIQAQGDGIWYGHRQDLGDGVIGDQDTVSWKWAQSFPLSLMDGLTGLAAVESKLGKGQLRTRDQAFTRAKKFIIRAAATGGRQEVILFKIVRFERGG